MQEELPMFLPSGGAVYADKGYCVAPARIAAARKGVHLCAIKKNNMKEKNFDLDVIILPSDLLLKECFLKITRDCDI